MKIYLTVVVKAKEAHREEVKQALQNLVVQTRNEQAAELYNLHQSVEDKNVFTFYEIWEDQAGLDLHNEQSYIKDFSKVADQLLAEPPILIKTVLI